ncbi:unnamed protein product [Rhizophagus irregularis]|nr:unnamed protein product [Rhizophagus irregularis]
MIKLIRLLKNEFSNVERISCAMHTLQLVIGKTLTCDANIQIFILRVKRSIFFFNSPKQLKHLIFSQEQLNYTKIYKTVKDVQTRWNSSFYSWKRLLLLKNALVYLPNKLKADQIKENTKDGNRLERIMLSEKKWRFMEELIIILKEFEEIIRILGGSNYITLSLLYPLVSKLKCFIGDIIEKYQNNKNNNNSQNLDKILSNDEIQGDILEEFKEIPDSESANTIEINENGSKKNLYISNPIEIKEPVLLFLNGLSKSLEKYWSVSSDVGLLTTLLDLHSKKLIYFGQTEKQRATTLLTERYEIYNLQKKTFIRKDEKNDENEDIMFDLNKSLMDSIFGKEENKDDGDENEVKEYLKLKPVRNINPLSW